MSKKHISWAGVFLCTLLLSFQSCWAASLCGDDEQVFFSCTLKNGKTVSLCASRFLDNKTGYLQYRFGKNNRIELKFPEEKNNSQEKFSYTHYSTHTFDRKTISFENHGYQYVIVYQRIIIDQYDGDLEEITQEVKVVSHNGVETSFKCEKESVYSRISELADIVLSL